MASVAAGYRLLRDIDVNEEWDLFPTRLELMGKRLKGVFLTCFGLERDYSSPAYEVGRERWWTVWKEASDQRIVGRDGRGIYIVPLPHVQEGTFAKIYLRRVEDVRLQVVLNLRSALLKKEKGAAVEVAGQCILMCKPSDEKRPDEIVKGQGMIAHFERVLGHSNEEVEIEGEWRKHIFFRGEGFLFEVPSEGLEFNGHFPTKPQEIEREREVVCYSLPWVFKEEGTLYHKTKTLMSTPKGDGRANRRAFGYCQLLRESRYIERGGKLVGENGQWRVRKMYDGTLYSQLSTFTPLEVRSAAMQIIFGVKELLDAHIILPNLDLERIFVERIHGGIAIAVAGLESAMYLPPPPGVISDEFLNRLKETNLLEEEDLKLPKISTDAPAQASATQILLGDGIFEDTLPLVDLSTSDPSDYDHQRVELKSYFDKFDRATYSQFREQMVAVMLSQLAKQLRVLAGSHLSDSEKTLIKGMEKGTISINEIFDGWGVE